MPLLLPLSVGSMLCSAACRSRMMSCTQFVFSPSSSAMSCRRCSSSGERSPSAFRWPVRHSRSCRTASCRRTLLQYWTGPTGRGQRGRLGTWNSGRTNRYFLHGVQVVERRPRRRTRQVNLLCRLHLVLSARGGGCFIASAHMLHDDEPDALSGGQMSTHRGNGGILGGEIGRCSLHRDGMLQIVAPQRPARQTGLGSSAYSALARRTVLRGDPRLLVVLDRRRLAREQLRPKRTTATLTSVSPSVAANEDDGGPASRASGCSTQPATHDQPLRRLEHTPRQPELAHAPRCRRQTRRRPA